MKLLFLLLLGAGLVQSQVNGTIPDCALSCISTSTNTTQCAVSDFSCLCQDPSFYDTNGDVLSCVGDQCSARDNIASLNIILTSCGIKSSDARPGFIAINTVFGILSLMFVGLRLLGKRKLRTSLQADDWLIIASEVFFWGYLSMNYWSVPLGYGLDYWAVPLDNFRPIELSNLPSQVCYMLTITTSKLSLLTLYLQIFRDTTFKRVVWIVMGLCICYGISFSIVWVFECNPPSYLWDHWDDPDQSKCLSFNYLIWWCSGINIFLDLVVIILPAREIFRLSLDRTKKIQLLGMFGLGFFITAVSCVRIQTNVFNFSSPNWTYDGVPQTNWTTVEAATSIIITCLPATRSLIRRFPKVRESWYRSRGKGNSTAMSETQNSARMTERGTISNGNEIEPA